MRRRLIGHLMDHLMQRWLGLPTIQAQAQAVHDAIEDGARELAS